MLSLTPLSAQISASKFQNLSQIPLKILKIHSAAPHEFSNFSVNFEIFPWCLSQIPNLNYSQRDVCYRILASFIENP